MSDVWACLSTRQTRNSADAPLIELGLYIVNRDEDAKFRGAGNWFVDRGDVKANDWSDWALVEAERTGLVKILNTPLAQPLDTIKAEIRQMIGKYAQQHEVVYVIDYPPLAQPMELTEMLCYPSHVVDLHTLDTMFGCVIGDRAVPDFDLKTDRCMGLAQKVYMRALVYAQMTGKIDADHA